MNGSSNLSHDVATKIQSPIKWIGGKRLQLQYIIPKILARLKCSNHYIEPFVGGGSVIIELLNQCSINNIKHNSFFCSDVNPILIAMFNETMNEPYQLIQKLKQYDNMKDETNYRVSLSSRSLFC